MSTTPCESSRIIKQALYEIGRQRTDDSMSLHRIQRILEGDEPDHCQDPKGSFFIPTEGDK
jgi:hypothetical protein